ncbi:MAG: sulfatase [Bryobacterales bacterium]|nr:sulfatase [Bryobacterales bacterium]
MSKALSTRRQWLGVVAGTAALTTAAQSSRRPNIVVILTDDQRWDAMGCAGHPWLKTPHIDKLAARGARFRNAFVTTSLCSPSRASILTGQYMHAHGVQDNFTPLPDALPTFPRELQQQGYRTAFLGKWHMGDSQLAGDGQDSDNPQPGFHHWISFKGQGVYTDPVLNYNGDRRKAEGYITDILTQEAVEFIGQQKQDQPFMLFLSHKAVHAGFEPAPRHRELYQTERVPAPGTAALREGKPKWLLRKRDESRHGLSNLYAGQYTLDSLYRDYMRTVAAVDDSVGAVEAALRRGGFLDDTLVIFLGDNGFLLGEQGLVDKRVMHEPSIRIPMLAAWPGRIPEGAVRDELVLNMDVATTAIAAAGIDASPTMHGRSLLGLFQSPSAPWRKEFVYEYFWDWEAPHTAGVIGLRSETHSYMEYQGIWDDNELYDIVRDPEQQRNLLAGTQVSTEAGGWLRRIPDPALQGLVRSMRAKMVEILNSTGGRHLTRGPA